MSKRIGFIDHDLNNFHANIYEELLRDQLASRNFTLEVCTATLTDEGKRWAGERKISYVDSISDMKGRVDGVIILAPANPETHLNMVKQAVDLQVPIYVDKTFAPDYETACEIFDIGDAANIPIISTSALRFTDEVPKLLGEIAGETLWQVQTWGGGRSYGEYVIHPLEWAISILGVDVGEVRVAQSGPLHTLTLNYRNGKRADVHVFPTASTPFRAILATNKRTELIELKSPIFLNTLNAILDFFETGKANVDRRETLLIRKIMDVALLPQAKQGILLPQIV